MSVSLTMVPVALALRVVMGKENFNEWTESHLNPQVTNFKSRKELTSILHKAGYDAVPFGPSVKTHFGNNNHFIWELRDGKWVALFSKYDSETDCLTLIKQLNEVAGRNLFSDKIIDEIAEHNHLEIPESAIFPTNFTDMMLLEQTLKTEKIPYQVNDDGSIVSTIDSVTLHFIQHQADGVIDLQVEDNTKTLQPIFKQMSMLDEAYRRQISNKHMIT